MKALFLSVLLGAAPLEAGVGIKRVEGVVEVYLKSLNRWKAVVNVPYGLETGDKLRLKPSSAARLEFDDGSALDFSGGAEFTLEWGVDGSATLRLDAGTVHADVKRFHDRVFNVETPAAKASLRADRASLSIDGRKTTAIEVASGLVNVEPRSGAAGEVPEGFRVEVPFGKPMDVRAGLKNFRRGGGTAGVSSAPALRRSKPPTLGPASLGLASGDKRPAGPALGPESLGTAPALGPESVGVKEARTPPSGPEADLGPESLGLKDPGPEKLPPRLEREGRRTALPAAEAKTGAGKAEGKKRAAGKDATSLDPLIDFRDFGVKPPKSGP